VKLQIKSHKTEEQQMIYIVKKTALFITDPSLQMIPIVKHNEK
jgi:hypothetical protein